MDEEVQGCSNLLLPGRAEGVHDVMVRLLGRCTCESGARVIELYTVDGARTAKGLECRIGA